MAAHPELASTRLGEVGWTFLRLGCVSFGGPIAHLGYLRTEIVEKRRWLDDAQYSDLVALCQFLPGPASSQVVFALGMLRAGLAGALLASTCFSLPSAALMIGFAYGVAALSDLQAAGWLHGLKLAAVAVVAQAVWGMGKKLCPDRARISLCLGAAATLLLLPGALAQLVVIVGGGALGAWLYREPPRLDTPASAVQDTRARTLGAAALVLFALLLVLLPLLASITRTRALLELDSFYRAGALVFGGGHVVLPLLRAELVPRGWLSDDQFLAGYGAAQALPGPLFTFAAYLGAAMHPGPLRWLHGAACVVAIFLPAWLLIGGALPFWQRLRSRRWAQAALAGANASVVGVLLSALYSPVIVQGVHGAADVAAALLAFALLEHWRVAPWLVVLGMAAAGQWALPR
jgi:chromate transporter